MTDAERQLLTWALLSWVFTSEPAVASKVRNNHFQEGVRMIDDTEKLKDLMTGVRRGMLAQVAWRDIQSAAHLLAEHVSLSIIQQHNPQLLTP